MLAVINAQACVQMNLMNVYNSGHITDYISTEDEIELMIGVGEDFVFKLSHSFRKGQVWSFDNSVSFPCYSDEGFYIQMTEDDEHVNDYAKI